MRRQEHTIGENKIFVEQLVPDEKKYDHPLVFIHGSFGGYFMWEKITSYLVNRGFECFSLSLRGHKPSGEADLAKVGMDDYAADVKSVIDELKLENPVLIGHSFAGLLVLMYVGKFDKTKAVVSIDPSPSLEVQGRKEESEVQDIPLVYSAMDAGMPAEPEKIKESLPDIPPEELTKTKDALGPESGLARRQRKTGISVPKESLNCPVLMIGAERAHSLAFGIPMEITRKMADYYDADLVEVKEATHPGIIMGNHAQQAAVAIENWLL